MKFLTFLLILSVSSAQANPISNRIFKDLTLLLEKGEDEQALYFLRNHNLELTGTDKFLAHFARGVLSARIGLVEEVFDEFSKVKNLPELKVYMDYYKGLTRFNEGKLGSAKTYLERSSKGDPQENMRREIDYLLGMIALKQRAAQSALKKLKPLIRKWKGRAERPKILYSLMDAGVRRKLYGKSRYCSWFRKLYEDHPTFPETKAWTFDPASHLHGGKKLGCDYGRIRNGKRLKRYFWEGQKATIVRDLEELKRNPKYQREYKSLLARFYYLDGDPKSALFILKELEAAEGRDVRYLSRLARVAYYADDHDRSMNTLKTGYQLSTTNRDKADFLFRMGFLNYELKKHSLAQKQFYEVIKKYPKTSQAYDSQWYYPWNLYLSGRFEEAFKAFQGFLKLIEQKPGRYRDFSKHQVIYWASRSLWKSGQVDLSLKALDELVRDPYVSYYSILASLQLRKLAKKNRLVLNHQAFLRMPWKKTDLKLKASAENFIESFKLSARAPSSVLIGVEDGIFNLDLEESIPKKSLVRFVPEVAKFDRQVKRYKLLSRLGFWDFAGQELMLIERKTRSKKLKAKILSFFEDIDAYKRSSRLATRSFGRERRSKVDAEARPYWEKAYPRAYREEVESNSSIFGIPQALIWGIMRAESFFDQRILSPVGARGLMQLMPFTASQVASLLGQKQGVDPDELLIPRVNIQLGTRYLQRLSKTFNGVLPFMAAAYNGGPHRVEWWVYLHGDRPMDEFTELISFKETRGYVKKVMRNYFVYENLYREKSLTDMDFMVDQLSFALSGPPATKETWEPL